MCRYSRLGASSRLRCLQYLPYLQSRDIEVTVAPLFGDDYVHRLYKGRISYFAVIRSYIVRLGLMLRSSRFDVIWVEKEMLPWLPSWIELGLLHDQVPIVVDYDDAVFHRYDQHRLGSVRILLGSKIDKIMRRAKIVVVGNEYLAKRAHQAGAKWIELIPTVVDTSRYTVLSRRSDQPLTIGWIGSPMTSVYIQSIAPVLTKIIKSRCARIVAVGANTEQVTGLPIETKNWSENSEVAEIQQFDIGIMPLPDEPFERGKCGYKLIQYMACGKPVVASPVGANKSIVRHGVEGFLASTDEDWMKSLLALCDDVDLRRKMGLAGRIRVEAEYSLEMAAPKLEKVFCFACSQRFSLHCSPEQQSRSAD